MIFGMTTSVAGARDCNPCALRVPSRRGLASDLRGQRLSCALSQCLRRGGPGLRESAGTERAGANAERATIPGCAARCSGDFRRAYHSRNEKVPERTCEARHGTKRVAKAVLIGAVPPLMLKTAANPGGLPMDAFDQIRATVLTDRSQFFKDLSAPFYGANRPGAKVSQGLRDSFWLQGIIAGHKAVFDCIKAFSETDFTEDLKKFDVPTLILHGDDDQIVPIGASAMLSSKIVKGATLKIYQGAPHGMCSTLKDQVNEELLTFFKRSAKAAA